MSKSLLVLGATGFIGTSVCRIANTRADRVDITDRDATMRFIEAATPDVIIALAGTRNVEWCERFPAEAERIHVDGIHNVLAAGVRVVYISTDAVFDGRSGNYDESFPPAPVNHYGRVKLLAERAVLAASPQNAAIRSSLVYGWNAEGQSSNTVASVIRSLRAGKQIALADNLFSTPLYVEDAAQSIVSIAQSGASGLFHLAGAACTSRYLLGVAAANEFGLDPSMILATTQTDGLRPLNVCLRSQRLAPCPDHLDGLRRMRRLLIP